MKLGRLIWRGWLIGQGLGMLAASIWFQEVFWPIIGAAVLGFAVFTDKSTSAKQ